MNARSAISVVVGRRLREIRVARGVALDRLAKQTGLSSPLLLAIEEGDQRPSLATIDKLARQLNVSVVDLVKSSVAAEGLAPSPAPVARAEPTNLQGIARSIAALPESVGDKLEAVELAVTKHALSVCGGNQSAAARLLGIERKALTRRVTKVLQADKKAARGR